MLHALFLNLYLRLCIYDKCNTLMFDENNLVKLLFNFFHLLYFF